MRIVISVIGLMAACSEDPPPPAAPEPAPEPAPAPAAAPLGPIPLGVGTSEIVTSAPGGDWLVGVAHVWGEGGTLHQHVVLFDERLPRGGAAADPLAGVARWSEATGPLVVRPFTMAGSACDAPNTNPPTRCFAAATDFHCRVFEVVEQRLGLDPAAFDTTAANAARRDLYTADGFSWSDSLPCGPGCADASGQSQQVTTLPDEGAAMVTWSRTSGAQEDVVVRAVRAQGHADLPHRPVKYTLVPGPSQSGAEWMRDAGAHPGGAWTEVTFTHAEAWTEACPTP